MMTIDIDDFGALVGEVSIGCTGSRAGVTKQVQKRRPPASLPGSLLVTGMDCFAGQTDVPGNVRTSCDEVHTIFRRQTD
jgi:hypothetical protein